MLIDIAVHDKVVFRVLSEEMRKEIRNALLTTKRYMFDTAASDKLFELAVNEPETVCEFADTAIPPYPNTYIEIDYSRHPKRIGWKVDPKDPPAMRIGYLYCDNGMTYVLSGDDKQAVFTPFAYADASKYVNTLMNRQLHRFIRNDLTDDRAYKNIKEILIAGIDPRHDDYPPLANIVHKLTDMFEVGICWDISRLSTDHDRELGEVLTDQAMEHSGAMRIGTASILLLNQRRVTTTYEKRTGPKIIRGKLTAMPPFNEVVIDLDAKHTTFHKIFSEGPAYRQRYHEVSGYWTYYDCATQCKHQWSEYRSESAEKRDIEKHGVILKRQICSLCGGRRTRKLAYTKGDIKLGKVEKTFKVTASRHRNK